jgi:hypothetical protein
MYLRLKKIEMESINVLPANFIEYEIKSLNCPDGCFIKGLKDSGFLEDVRAVLRKFKTDPCSTELHEELKAKLDESEEDWKVVTDAVKTTTNNRYGTFSTKILFNIGQFDLPLIDGHIKDVYGDKSLSTVKMYLSANI